MIQQLLAIEVYGLPSTPGIVLEPGDKGWQNMLADEAKNPRVFMDLPITWNYTDLTFLTELYNIRMLFACKSELDQTPEQHEVNINFCRQMVREFLSRCNTSVNVTLSDVSAVEIWNVYDANYDGILLSFKAKPDISEPIC